MWSIPCRVVGTAPDDDRELVTVAFEDAFGRKVRMTDKLAVFRCASGRDGIRCTVHRLGRHEGRLAHWVSTEQPDDVEDADGNYEFVISDLDFAGSPPPHDLAAIPRREGWVDIDFLQHDIACALRALPAETEFWQAKPYYWSNTALGEWTLSIVRDLQADGLVRTSNDDDTVLRWAS